MRNTKNSFADDNIRAYPRIYLTTTVRAAGSYFERAAEKRIDCIGTINALLNSEAFRQITYTANPKYLNMGSWQLFDCVLCDEGYDWQHSKRKKKYDPYEMWWTGTVLEVFRWSYCIDFREWLKYETVEDIYNCYYPLHEAGIQVAASKIMARYWHLRLYKCPPEELDENKAKLKELIQVYPDIECEFTAEELSQL